jgi:hypothetical protein
MPSAIDALSGDMKMLESARVLSSSRSRPNPNALLAPMTPARRRSATGQRGDAGGSAGRRVRIVAGGDETDECE